ncbi:hypothetical protein PIB30_114989, partial [Stylosanthes scabra]|nr:hypothetical protein [Stylosanthes scabra]
MADHTNQRRTIADYQLEKLEASAMGTQVACGICGGPHENHNCMLTQENQFYAEQ